MAQGSLNDLLMARLAASPAAAPAPSNHNVLAGLTTAAPAPATGPVSNPSAMSALFGTAPANPPVAAVLAPANPPVASGGGIAGLLGALSSAPAPAAPAPAPPAVLTAPTGISALLGQPTPAPAPAAPPVALVPAAPATGVVPPDAPASDPALTLDDVKVIEAGTKKRGRPKKTDATTANEPATGDDMLTVLTRIAVALEALAAKGS